MLERRLLKKGVHFRELSVLESCSLYRCLEMCPLFKGTCSLKCQSSPHLSTQAQVRDACILRWIIPSGDVSSPGRGLRDRKMTDNSG